MTIYERPRAEVFAQDAPPSEIQPFQAWLRGLGIAFDETNGFPEMTGLNGLFNALNLYIKYLEQNGFAEWRPDMEYPAGAGVRVGMIWYRAKNQNTNKPPATSQNDWELFLNASDIKYVDPFFLDNQKNLRINMASTLDLGVVNFATSAEVGNKANISKVINPSNAATISQSTDLGVGQSWVNVTGSRATNVNHTNSTAKPIMVSFSAADTIGQNAEVSIIVGGVTILVNTYDSGDKFGSFSHSFIVPSGSTYRINLNISGVNWMWSELR